MLKALLLTATLCCIAMANIVAMAKAYGNTDYLLDCGSQKIVIFSDTKSPDGRYALGWTLRPLHKKVAPVDWSFWSFDDENALPDHYHMDEGSGQANYSIDYFAVDLRSKKTLPIPADFRFAHPSAYGGCADVAWSGDVDGKRYGLFEFHYVGGAGEVFLASLSGNEMKLIDLRLEDVVQAQLPKHTSLDQYTTVYRVTEDVSQRKLSPFHGPYADIIYWIGIRHSAGTPSAAGIITLHLTDGKVMRITNDGWDDETEAIRDNPDINKADAELNKVYHLLENKLTPATREALKKEQTAWIKTRNAAVEKASANAPDGATETTLRDKAQLDSTRKRTADLQSRLESSQYKDPAPDRAHSSTGAFLINDSRDSRSDDNATSNYLSIARRENPGREYRIYAYPRFADLYFSPHDAWAAVDDHCGSGSNQCALLKATAKPPFFVPATPSLVDDACWDLFWSQHPRPKGKLIFTHRRTIFCQWLDDTRCVIGLSGESWNEKGAAQNWGIDGYWHCIYDAATCKATADAFTATLDKDFAYTLEKSRE